MLDCDNTNYLCLVLVITKVPITQDSSVVPVGQAENFLMYEHGGRRLVNIHFKPDKRELRES